MNKIVIWNLLTLPSHVPFQTLSTCNTRLNIPSHVPFHTPTNTLQQSFSHTLQPFRSISAYWNNRIPNYLILTPLFHSQVSVLDASIASATEAKNTRLTEALQHERDQIKVATLQSIGDCPPHDCCLYSPHTTVLSFLWHTRWWHSLWLWRHTFYHTIYHTLNHIIVIHPFSNPPCLTHPI